MMILIILLSLLFPAVVSASSFLEGGTYSTGLFGNSPKSLVAGSVVTSSGSLVVQSTSTTAGHFVLRVNNASATELMRVQQNGAVGVGTSSPDSTFHILSGSAGDFGASGSGDDLVVEAAGAGGISILTPNANTASLYFGSVADNIGAVVDYNNSTLQMSVGTDIASGFLRFLSGSFSERMRIDTNGNVGIGTTGPATKLHCSSCTLTIDGNVTNSINVNGTILSTRATDLGWSIVNAANQACNTTCTNACVFGMDTGALGNFVACDGATADTCVCAGAN